MKAIVWTDYGSPDVLQLQEVEKPVPGDDQVLVRVYATSVSTGDCELRSLKLPVYFSLPLRMYAGLQKPQRMTILGQEFAGVIEAAGKNVKLFSIGDPVFGTPGFSLGAYAEYLCVPENPVDAALAKKPENLTFDEAGAVPFGGLEALHFLRKAELKRGEEVLIIGAGGSIGTMGVQLAKVQGATVTAVDSTGKLEMLRSIGADQVIDYTQEDYTKQAERYDVIFDVVGKSSYSACLRSLKQKGRYLLANPGLVERARGRWTSLGNKKVIMGSGGQNSADLVYLKELIEAGKIKVVIDRRYPLEQAAEAHRYVETGEKKGNVILTIGRDDEG